MSFQWSSLCGFLTQRFLWRVKVRGEKVKNAEGKVRIWRENVTSLKENGQNSEGIGQKSVRKRSKMLRRKSECGGKTSQV